MNELSQRLSAAQLRLRVKHPFFASLALFTQVRVTERVETAATDGRDIYFNPVFLEGLTTREVDGVLLHEVLHAALLHVIRCGTRDPLRWNYAADLVVNAMVTEQGLDLPPGAVQLPKWADRSVEEVYDLLQKQQKKPPEGLLVDLRADLASSTESKSGSSKGADSLEHSRARELRAHWQLARQQAHVIARQIAQQQGSLTGDTRREWDTVDTPQIDWRAELWRYLVQTPVDFSGYDRRFIYRGLYIDQMAGETLNLWVAIDISGSINQKELDIFKTELLGILRAYPHIRCHLFYADADLYGPYELRGNEAFPEPRGGGGTSFVPFFEALDGCQQADLPYVCVYLTDGYGGFPAVEPEVPTLWLVTSGGLLSSAFPFGKVIRLLSD